MIHFCQCLLLGLLLTRSPKAHLRCMCHHLCCWRWPDKPSEFTQPAIPCILFMFVDHLSRSPWFWVIPEPCTQITFPLVEDPLIRHTSHQSHTQTLGTKYYTFSFKELQRRSLQRNLAHDHHSKMHHPPVLDKILSYLYSMSWFLCLGDGFLARVSKFILLTFARLIP